VATFYKQMVFLGTPLVTVAEGEIHELHIGLKGTMSALLIKVLAIKTHRGLEGRARERKSGGGLSYGYRAVRLLLENGEVQGGDREIIPAEAAVIQRMFEEYLSGHSAREVASGLSDDRIPAPDSANSVGSWRDSTISGNHKRGTGILNNELYIGRLVWNRLSYIKTLPLKSGCRASTLLKNGSSPRCRNCASSAMAYGRRSKFGRLRCAS